MTTTITNPSTVRPRQHPVTTAVTAVAAVAALAALTPVVAGFGAGGDDAASTNARDVSVDRWVADPTGLGTALSVLPPVRAVPRVADPTGLGAALAFDPTPRLVADPTGLGAALAFDPTPRLVADPTGLGAVLGSDVAPATGSD